VVQAVERAHLVRIHMRVDLGRADRGVAEELLHGTQVRAPLEEVRREGVAQGVRVDAAANARAGGGGGDAAPGRGAAQGRAAA
jgi:hypothetical protein